MLPAGSWSKGVPYFRHDTVRAIFVNRVRLHLLSVQKQRRGDELLRRAAETRPREEQEAGQRAFRNVIDIMERRSRSLDRLRWEFTAELGDMQVPWRDFYNLGGPASEMIERSCRVVKCRVRCYSSSGGVRDGR